MRISPLKPSAVVKSLALICLLIPSPGLSQVHIDRARTVRFEGVVVDSLSGDPVPFAVASIDTLNASALTDRLGRFFLEIPPGTWNLKVRKIGYRMRAETVDVQGNYEATFVLQPFPVMLDVISVTAQAEDPAMRIIRQAIARKRDVLARINDFRYDAYVKLLVADLEKSPDSADALFMISETQTTAYWEQPDRYQEVIVGRQQSRNLDAQENLVSVGQMVNFTRDRIDLQKYAIVSPTAEDALDFYEYHMLDTLEIEGRRVFRLAIEPKSQAVPLFVGMIDIADSTFDVVAIDVGANDAVRFDFFRNLRYRQRLEDVNDEMWMPVDIRFSGEIHVGIPIPGFPEHLSFEHQAILSEYRFDQGNAPSSLGEYLIVVDENADDIDSTEWAAARPVPLEEEEAMAYRRIDSLAQIAPSMGRVLLGGLAAGIAATNNRDIFHFNRVEGVYLGFGGAFRELSPDIVIRAKTGYALGAKLWQHQFGLQYRLSSENRTWASAWYRDEVVTRPTMISQGANGTQEALLAKTDPSDYYRIRGVVLSLGTKIVDFTRLTIQYNDLQQNMLPLVSDFSVLRANAPVRENPPIVEGRLRSVSATLSFDSRRLLRRGGRDYYFNAFTYTQFSLSAEVSDPGIIPSDFSYGRFAFSLHRRQRTLNWGLTFIDAVAGVATGNLPPQRYFTVDLGKAYLWQRKGFNTLRDVNFAGDKAAMVFVRHDFERQLFSRTRIPGVQNLPFTVSVHAGVFWTDLSPTRGNPGDDMVRTAPSGYSEIGFGVGNLTPMFAPVNLAVSFSWQVSSYGTRRFAVAVGIPAP